MGLSAFHSTFRHMVNVPCREYLPVFSPRQSKLEIKRQFFYCAKHSISKYIFHEYYNYVESITWSFKFQVIHTSESDRVLKLFLRIPWWAQCKWNLYSKLLCLKIMKAVHQSGPFCRHLKGYYALFNENELNIPRTIYGWDKCFTLKG